MAPVTCSDSDCPCADIPSSQRGSASQEDNPGKGLVRAKLLCIRTETDQAKLPSTQTPILGDLGRGGQHTALIIGAVMEAWGLGDSCDDD